MIRAYDEVYLQPAQDNMAFMLDYAVNDAGFTIEDFFRLFIGSRFARRFEAGDYMYITGMSGIELAGRILEAAGMAYRIREPRIRFHRTEEHWAGWILAYYQWWSALTFREIEEAIGITGHSRSLTGKMIHCPSLPCIRRKTLIFKASFIKSQQQRNGLMNFRAVINTATGKKNRNFRSIIHFCPQCCGFLP